jgi:hypothetical protein
LSESLKLHKTKSSCPRIIRQYVRASCHCKKTI